ncbi:MAG: NUDIX hydrolase [Bacteroidales bacterium]|nr:NUDIX hydrolase [Clostridium sp.]MCM1204022.1 NUDIX hydrolase [Bacteroidales bacterium]
MEPVKRLKRELRAQGTVIGLYKDTVEINGQVLEWDYIHHDGAAAVVAVNEDGKLLMVRQYRNALDRFTLELPAGKLDAPGEPTLECAKRELEEETGYRGEDFEYLLTLNTTVAFCNEKVDIYLAKNLKKTAQHLDPEEEINVELWDIRDLQQMIYEGKMTDAKTVAGIMTYAQKQVKQS